MKRVCRQSRTGGSLAASLALCALLAGAAMAGEVPAGRAGLVARVLGCDVRIYESRDPFSPTLRLASGNEVFPVHAKSGGWVQLVLPDGGTGWVVNRHVAVTPVRRPGTIGHLPGTRRQALGALTGTLAGGTVAFVYFNAALSTTGFLEGLFQRVHGSGGVSRTTADLAHAAALAAMVLAPAAAAYGTHLASEKDRPAGSMLLSWGCAAAGSLAGIAVARGLDELLGSSGAALGLLVGVAGTALGAVAGYEASRPAWARSYGWAGRVSPPTVGLATERTAEGRSAQVYRFDLVAVRF